MRAKRDHADQRHRCLLHIHQRQPAPQDLCGPQQVCDPQRAQVGFHRGHPLPPGQVTRGAQQSHALQQPPVRDAEIYRGHDKDCSSTISVWHCSQRDDGQSHRTIALYTSVQDDAGPVSSHVRQGGTCG